jgi:hypothetical protein
MLRRRPHRTSDHSHSDKGVARVNRVRTNVSRSARIWKADVHDPDTILTGAAAMLELRQPNAITMRES